MNIPPDTEFSEALRLLESRINFEKMLAFKAEDLSPRLDRLRRFLALSGNPQRKYKTIHVAGTKGKGSVCAMLESVFLAAGRRVGLFSSPHLYSFLERFRIDGIACPENDFGTIMLSLRDRMTERDPELLSELTYFELTVLFAFEYFARKQVDIAIFEVGLGGRYDATNICEPCLTLISSISFDHMEQLGPTLEDIAFEKGGIIKPGVPLVSTVRRPEVKAVFRRIAEERNAPVFFLNHDFQIRTTEEIDGSSDSFHFETLSDRFPRTIHSRKLTVNLPGEHQQRNAALVVAAISLFQDREHGNIDENTIRRGLENVSIPIRVEILQNGPDRPTLVVDGAHNRDSVKEFVETVWKRFPDRRKILVFGTTLGKDIEGMFAELIGRFDSVFLTQHSSSPRRFPTEGLKAVFRAQPNIRSTEIEIVEDSREALESAWSRADADDVVCVTGSMYLAAELREFYFEKIVPSR